MNAGEEATTGVAADGTGANGTTTSQETPAAADEASGDRPRREPDRGFLPRRPLTRAEAVIGVAAIVAWMALVAAGVAVPTKPYIDLLASPTAKPTPLELAKAVFVILTCYTFTNVAALCCLAAVVGAIGRSAQIDDVARDDPATDLRTLCISGMIRGFFLFLVILSGTLILADQKFDDISIEQYLKLSGLVSVLSFAIGYDPRRFVTLFQRVSQWTNSTTPPGPR
ncbi:MAG TPA: hypothetical protein VG406_20375 [Isosphaeraceae bacterium]|jgi:hypothetical protein|nr:hypothetical protein [Isosphaeraceae bacterium]